MARSLASEYGEKRVRQHRCRQGRAAIPLRSGLGSCDEPGADREVVCHGTEQVWAAPLPEGWLVMLLRQVRPDATAVPPGPRVTSAERCDKCDLLIGAGCACSVTRTAVRTEYVGGYRWIRFGPDALLISRRNMAHVPGACDHFTEEWVLDPKNG